jgi:dTMP kinase
MVEQERKGRGLFITVEGIEGAGKSTIIQFLRDYLQQRNVDCVTTREFGGTEVAEAVRELLLDRHYETEKMCQDTEILLAFAGRAQHLVGLIRPALQQGKWVLCDRFTDSTYAYQSYGRGATVERVAVIEQWVQQGLKPDYTILLDVDVAVGMTRLHERKRNQGVNLDRIESEGVWFFQRIRDGYLAMAAQEPQRFRVINASQSKEEVLMQLEQIFSEIVNNHL